jgi:serine/threonine protein phosphatase 1
LSRELRLRPGERWIGLSGPDLEFAREIRSAITSIDGNSGHRVHFNVHDFYAGRDRLMQGVRAGEIPPGSWKSQGAGIAFSAREGPNGISSRSQYVGPENFFDFEYRGSTKPGQTPPEYVFSSMQRISTGQVTVGRTLPDFGGPSSATSGTAKQMPGRESSAALNRNFDGMTQQEKIEYLQDPNNPLPRLNIPATRSDTLMKQLFDNAASASATEPPGTGRKDTASQSGRSSDASATSQAAKNRGPIFMTEPVLRLPAQSTDGRTLIVLPDTHGRDDLQQKAFDYLERNQDWVFGDNTSVISLGDTIDKGPNSAQNVEDLINRANHPGVKDVTTHIGNHELWLTQWLESPDKLSYAHDWIKNRGGKVALESYERFAQANPDQSNFSLDGLDLANMPVREIDTPRGEKKLVPDNSNGFYSELYQRIINGFPTRHLDFYNGLQKSTQIGDYFFSHAGADPRVPLQDQGLGALTWIRDPYLRHTQPWQGNENTVAVSGHTILRRPLIQENKFAMDLGTFMTGDFMVAILQNDLVRFGIFRRDAEPVFTDINGGFERDLFAPVFDPADVIKNPKR